MILGIGFFFDPGVWRVDHSRVLKDYMVALLNKIPHVFLHHPFGPKYISEKIKKD